MAKMLARWHTVTTWEAEIDTGHLRDLVDRGLVTAPDVVAALDRAETRGVLSADDSMLLRHGFRDYVTWPLAAHEHNPANERDAPERTITAMVVVPGSCSTDAGAPARIATQQPDRLDSDGTFTETGRGDWLAVG